MRTRLAVLCAVLFVALVPWPTPAGDSVLTWTTTRADSAVRQRSEHLAKLGVAEWHAAGCRGTGVTVAVLDAGFRGYRDQLGKSLPANVRVKTFRRDGNFEGRNSQHGVLVGEVVHAIAPDANLLFVNWEPDDPDAFLAAVRWAREQGARVMTCSVISPTWSDGEGGGPIHRGLSELLGSGKNDPLFFSCAGNVAQRSWAGTFQAGASGFHQWADGVTANPVRPWGNERVSLELCWSDPAAGYSLELIDAATGAPIEKVTRKSIPGRLNTVLRFRPEPGRSYAVRLRQEKGVAGPFHFTALAAGLGEARASGSIPFPGDGPEVITVGAVNPEGQRSSFSACGPNSRQPKPDVVAPVPFASLFRSKPFSGTSAATPQAAGVAALCLSLHPDWSAAQVRQCISCSACDLGPKGHDCETGFGLVHLPAAPKPVAAVRTR